jgi:hypothetical protein
MGRFTIDLIFSRATPGTLLVVNETTHFELLQLWRHPRLVKPFIHDLCHGDFPLQTTSPGWGVLEGTEEEVEEVVGLNLLAMELLHILCQHVDELLLCHQGRQVPEKEKSAGLRENRAVYSQILK